MGIKRWKLPQVTPEQARSLMEETGLSELVCRVLCARGCRTREDYDSMFAGHGELDDPFLLRDMDLAVERISHAVEEGERIAIYGDYDCDGITATTLLTSYFQSVGADSTFYVPSREKEGYGLNRGAVKALADMGINLIITVDNGISAHDEIAYAAELGMDVVVTDHHTPREDLPPAVAVVNPHRADCPSRFKGLAGVGVAFKLVCALEGDWGEEMLEYYSDLVALGTVADVVPLVGENRIIVRHGLERLRETERPGLSALLQVSGLAGKPLTGESMAFGIIPRINAAGRMGTVDDAIELLLTDDVSYAMELAETVDAQNVQRKEIEDGMLAEIDGYLAENPDALHQRVLVVSGRDWHHGVVGIVAAKLVDRYGKPCILLSIEGDVARGSGRSIEGFSLIKAITACGENLQQYGGHTLAAGLTLAASEIERFNAMLQEYAREQHPVMPVPLCVADCVLQPAEMTPEALRPLQQLEPFGNANELPLFLLQGLRVEGIYPTGDQKHIRIRFSAGGSSFYAVYFRMSESRFPYKAGDVLDVMANVSAAEYMGKPQVSVRIKDLRPQDVEQEDVILDAERYACFLREEPLPVGGDLVPDREDLAVIYKYIRKCKSYPYGETGLYFHLKRAVGYCKLHICLDVLEELGLVHREDRDGRRVISLVPGASKVDLDGSGILTKLRAAKQGENVVRV